MARAIPITEVVNRNTTQQAQPLSVQEFLDRKKQETQKRIQQPKVDESLLGGVAKGVGKSALGTLKEYSGLGEQILGTITQALLPKSLESQFGIGEQVAPIARTSTLGTAQPTSAELLQQQVEQTRGLTPGSLTESQTGAQAFGKFAGDIAQFALPAGRLARAGKTAEAAIAARGASRLGRTTARVAPEVLGDIGIGTAQTGDIREGITQGAIGAGFAVGVPRALKGIKQAREARIPSATEAAGRVLQAGTKGEALGARVLGRIDTKNVRTYKQLSDTLEKEIDQSLKKVDEGYGKVKETYKLNKLTQETTSESDGLVTRAKVNFVKNAMDDLAELYEKTRDPASLSRVKSLQKKAVSKGLTPQEINKLAKEYGSIFGRRAFSKIGEPLTSVNARSFENTRKGLKSTARQFLPNDELKQIDEQISEMIRVREMADKMKERVSKLEQRVRERGLVEKISRALGQAVDVATFGGPRAFISKLLLPSNVGLKTMNSLDIEKELARNLKLINKLEGSSDKTVVDTLSSMFRAKKPQTTLGRKKRK